MVLGTDVATVSGEIEGRFWFAIFSIAVGALANEMRFVPALGPSLTRKFKHTERDDLRI